MPTLHEQTTRNVARDATIVAFNMRGEHRMDEDDQPIPAPVPAEQVIELADMTDEQKRIVEAGETIAGSFPQGLTREQLSAWMDARFGNK
jgi:hypothetical protein